MSEAELQRLVAELCADLGLAHYHTHDSRRSEPGFPDSVIIGTKILFRELKSANGTLGIYQRRWGARIERAGGDWAVWRPADWRNDVIFRQLRKIRPAPLLTSEQLESRDESWWRDVKPLYRS